MPTYLTPGVYVEELSAGAKPIVGVSTSTACFIGAAEKGPIGKATFVSSFQEFVKFFGGPIRIIKGSQEHYLYYTIRHFFQEGGTRCYVVRASHFTDIDNANSLEAVPASLTLDGVDINGNSAGSALKIEAINAGPWGESIQVQVVNSSKFSLLLAEDIPASTDDTQLGKTTISLADNSDVKVGSLLWIVEEVTGKILSADQTNQTVKFQGSLMSGGAVYNGAIADGTPSYTSDFKLMTETEGARDVSDGAPGADIKLKTVATIDQDPVDPAKHRMLKNGEVLSFVLKEALVEVKKIGHKTVNNVKFMTVEVDFGSQTFTAFSQATSRVYARDFTINVKLKDTIVETHEHLSLVNTNATDYVESRLPDQIGKASFSVTASDLNTSNEILLNNTEYTSLANGSDKLSDLVDADIIGSQLQRTGIFALDLVTDGSILVIPNASEAVSKAAITYVEKRQDLFYVMDHPSTSQETVIDYRDKFSSTYAAIYYPWFKVEDIFTGCPISVPPSGAVAGIYADTDGRRGVHKAPAGIDNGFMNVATGIDPVVSKGENDRLYQHQINVIRKFPEGIVVWGARNMTQDIEWIYVNVRRLFIFLEQSIERGTRWTVFEPNDRTLWKSIVRNVSAFLRIQWLEGKLVGDKEEKAFYVKCDEETNPPEVFNAGYVITEIGVAPSKPAEFVVFRIRQFAGNPS